jgi:two-component system LytT family sensor kinase
VKKRVLNHILFWTFYAIEDSFFEFTYIRSFFPKISDIDLIGQAVTANLVVIAPKLLVTYFVFYFSIPKALNKKENIYQVSLITLSVLLFSIFCYIFLGAFFLRLNPANYGAKVSYKDSFTLVHFFNSFMDIGFISGIAIIIKLFKMQLVNLKKGKDIARGKLESELKFLKNQINPHFLFNTLNNIYALARKKSDQAPDIILKLSKLLRFMLYETNRDKISIAEEIRILEDYVDVEKVMFSGKLHISFEKNIDDETHCITPLILLPFIENAFKHGPGSMVDDSFININIELNKGELNFLVVNSKDVANHQKTTEKIGLSNVRRRLELMYSEYKLTIEHVYNTFTVNLYINLNTYAAV